MFSSPQTPWEDSRVIEAGPPVKMDEAEHEDNAPTVSVSVIVPAYNERTTIAEEVRSIREALAGNAFSETEIIVVDDGSTDNTAELARGAGATVVAHPVNLGQGAAIKTGITKARGSHIAVIDADGTYPTEDLPRLVSFSADSGYEQVVGDRQSERGSLRLLRVPVKALLRTFAAFLSGQAVGDMNSGMRVLSREAALRYLPLIPDGFSNSTTLTLASLSHRGRIAFIPIDYKARKDSQSKFRPVEDTYNMMLTIIRMVMYVDPLRVLLPVAFLFLVAGFAKAVTDVFRFDLHITTSSVLVIMTGIQIAAIALIADLIVRRTR
jgi:glycosyltransferase involved in cell wall biosynthesis